MSTRGICVLAFLVVLFVPQSRSSADPLYFDAGNSTVWDNGATANWASTPGPPYDVVWAAGADARFEGAAGAVTVNGPITSVNAIAFDSSGYMLAGGTITITGDGRISGSGDNAISSVLAGSVPMTKLGAGKLTLAGSNTFTGLLTVAEGTLSIANWNTNNSNGPLGNSSSRIVLGSAGATGTLEFTATGGGGTARRGIELAAGGTGMVHLEPATGTRSSNYIHIDGVNITGSGAFTVDTSHNAAQTSRFIIVGNTAITGPITVNPYSELQNNLASAGDNTPFGAGTITVDSNGILNVFRSGSDATAILGGLAGSGRVHAEGSGVKTYKIGANNESTAFSGTIANSASGTGPTVAVTKIGTGALTLSGVNSFSGPLRVEEGILTLSGANTFTGQVTVAGGTLSIGTWNDNGIAGPLGQSATKVQLDGGTIRYTGGSVGPNKSLHMAGVGTIDVVDAGTVLNLGAAGSNSLTGAGDIIKEGLGTLQLAQASVAQWNWSGKLMINAGTVDFFGSDSMPKPASIVPDAVQINDGGTFAFSYSGTSPGGSQPNANLGFQLSGNAGFAITAGTHELQGVIANKPGQTGNLIKTGVGTLVLSGENTYSGTTTVAAGTLALQGGNNRISTGNLVIANDAVLSLDGNQQTVWNVGSSGVGNGMAGAIQNGDLRFTGNMYIKSGTVDANLSNAGGSTGRLWIGGDTSATVLLAGDNTHTYSDNYATIIGHSTTGAAGAVRLGGNNALGGAGNRTDVYSGTLDLNGQNAVVQERIRLMATGSAFLVNSNTAADAGTAAQIVMQSSNSIGGAGNMTLGGVVSGGGTLTKTGAGSLTLSNGANTHTGATIVSAGSLLINGSTHASSAVTARANATLGGTGTVGGATTIQSGGKLATGASIGTLTFGGPLSLESGAVWDWEYVDNSPGNYDQAAGPQLFLPASGAVTFNIHGLTGHSVFPGDKFTVFTGDVQNFSPDRIELKNHSKWTSWEMSTGGSLVLTADSTISLSTDVLNAGQATPGAWVKRPDGYFNTAGVELVRFVDRFSSSLNAVAYTQTGTETIDVSSWVATSGTGGQRGASQQLQVNGYAVDSPYTTDLDLYLRGEDIEYNEGFGAHANWLVTFDLDAIREEHFAGTHMPFQLTGEFGTWGGIGSTGAGDGIVQGAVFLDGVRIDGMDPSIANPASSIRNLAFDVTISSGRYLTFGIFNGATTVWDDGVFKNVNLTMIPEPGVLPMLLAACAAWLAVRRRRR